MKKGFLQWWIIALTSGVIVFWAAYFGVIGAIWKTDVTHITTLTMAIFVAASVHLGYNTYRLSPENYKEVAHSLEVGWFASEACMTLGLLGTAIGFILMMTTQLGTVNAADPTAMMVMITNISISLGTALYTTAVGIGTGLMLKVQCFNLQHFLDLYDEEA